MCTHHLHAFCSSTSSSTTGPLSGGVRMASPQALSFSCTDKKCNTQRVMSYRKGLHQCLLAR